MKAKVVYFSLTGNTKKVAEAIAGAAGCRAESAEKAEVNEVIDVLFIGAAVYATHDHNVNPEIRNFINRVKNGNVKKVVVFGTYAFGSSIEKLAQIARDKGLSVAEENFTCKGKFFFFNRKAPGAEDLEKARAFAKRITNT